MEELTQKVPCVEQLSGEKSVLETIAQVSEPGKNVLEAVFACKAGKSAVGAMYYANSLHEYFMDRAI